jgi:hypothetical protein
MDIVIEKAPGSPPGLFSSREGFTCKIFRMNTLPVKYLE